MNEKSKPLVSIMMPCRNASKYLAATIKSIQAQTYDNWELIFVDDGSNDSTLEIIEGFAKNDDRIKVFSISHGGRGVARNECIKYLTGEFVAVCDADDICFPERFAKQVDFLIRNPEIGVVGAWWIPFDTALPEKNSPLGKLPTHPQELKRAFSSGKMRFHNATAMLRNDLFKKYGKYNVELRRAQDYEFFSRLNKNGVVFAALPEPLIYYRQESVIPRISYFTENGMFMAYADKALAGYTLPFSVFAKSLEGIAWKWYYSVKYIYFYSKLFFWKILNR